MWLESILIEEEKSLCISHSFKTPQNPLFFAFENSKLIQKSYKALINK
jgi:hypothetical protein